MSRRLSVVLVTLGAAHAVAGAQPAGSASDPPAPADPAAPAAESTPPPATAPDPSLFAPPPASPPPATASPADEDVGDQEISAELGLATGGRVTPGGLRIAGHYLYQLSSRDWFDGTASFTFGSGSAACYRDRSDAVVCDHGLTDGSGVEISASIRRWLPPRDAFRPFARAGVGLGLARFADDDVSGFTVVLHGGGGVRVGVTPSIAVVAEGDLALGLGSFNRGLGLEPQLGLVITAGVEFRLR